MPENLEVKARLIDISGAEQIALSLGARRVGLLFQRDTYFLIHPGRLKLREFGDKTAELIYYERNELSRHRRSMFQIARCVNPDGVREILSKALGTRSVVEKKRTLYLYGSTRIHFDEVTGLGNFVEIESPIGTSVEVARRVTSFLTKRLQLKDSDYVPGSYVDLLEAVTSNNPEKGCRAGSASFDDLVSLLFLKERNLLSPNLSHTHTLHGEYYESPSHRQEIS